MSLSAGARLGPYEIVSALGAGGMGEVYKARDSKLNRSVAIKVLPSAVAGDPDRLARFTREAQLLAALNHPNIGAIYGLEDSGGIRALVMELVEGPTLADRIALGPIPLDEALPIAKRIAEALEAAHGQGIIHRDLKPANIKVRADGAVKVLDFGLAKALDPVVTAGTAMDSPTITSPAALTRQGVILGTAAYMAPEQARGRAVDTRADIWAFGCVLYEMLTGRRTFDGDDVTDALASVIKSDPDWRPLPAATPAGIRRLLKRCLAKNPAERLQAIGDARIEIDDALRTPESAALESTAPVRMRRSVPLTATVGVAACALVVGAIAAAIVLAPPLRRGSAPPAAVVARTIVTVAPADQLRGNGPVEYLTEGRPSRTAMALSPDGRSIVFSAIRGDRQQLYLHTLDRLEASPIAGTEGGASPFFSPDGKWVGFWTAGALKKVALDGGAGATAICQTNSIVGASWGSRGTIVFGTGGGGLWQVAAAGGTPERLTKLDASKGEVGHRLPQFLPGGGAVVFTVLREGFPKWNDTTIAVVSLATGERKDLLQGADARYVATGHLLLVRAGALLAVPFDVAHLQVTGGAVTVIPDVMQAAYMPNVGNDSGAGQFAVSESGSLVYVPGGVFPDPERSLVWIDRRGAAQPVGAPLRAYYGVRLSPDGRRIAAWTSGSDRNVWIYDIARGALSRLTNGRNAYAVWASDATHVAFESGPGVANIFWKVVDGSAPQERLTTSEFSQTPMSWSPDGQTLAFTQGSATTSNDIWVLPVAGDRHPRPIVQTPFNDGEPDFSPDGKWLAYTSNESGRSDVYVQPYPGPGPRQQVSIDGGRAPAWSRDGRELFYMPGPANAGEAPTQITIMAVPVTTRTAFTAGKPVMLWQRPSPVAFLGYRPYDVTADGRRFLTVESKERPPIKVTEMILIQNWVEELKRLVPAK